MNVCLLILCEEPGPILHWVVTQIGLRLKCKGVAGVRGILPVEVMDTQRLSDSLEHGQPLPEFFTQARAKLMFGIDSTSTAYLERVSTELGKMCQSSESRAQAPTILQMHDVVLKECRRRALERVWVQDTSKDATEQRLSEQLKHAGLDIRDPRSPRIEHELWLIQSQLAGAQLAEPVDAERVSALTNYFRERLCFLARQGGFQAVILDRYAAPFLEAEKQSAPWGPQIVDGFGLYLDAVADWMIANLPAYNAPPPTR